MTWHSLLIFIKSRVPFLSCDIKIISVSRQSCSTLCDSMDCSLPSSSVHGISQARALEWIAIPFSREFSRSRNQTQVSCIVGKFFTIWAPSYFLFLSPKTIGGVKREGVCICGEGEPWVPEKGVRAKVGWGGHPPREGVGGFLTWAAWCADSWCRDSQHMWGKSRLGWAVRSLHGGGRAVHGGGSQSKQERRVPTWRNG